MDLKVKSIDKNVISFDSRLCKHLPKSLQAADGGVFRIDRLNFDIQKAWVLASLPRFIEEPRSRHAELIIDEMLSKTEVEGRNYVEIVAGSVHGLEMVPSA